MIHYLKLSMTCLVVSTLFIVSCGGGGGDTVSPGPVTITSGVIVGQNTQILETDTLASTLQSVSADGQTLTFSDTPEIRALSIGDVIVAGHSALTPKGFMKRITSKADFGGNIILETEPAALADVFESASFSASEPLNIEGDGTVITDIADGVVFVDYTPADRMVIEIVRTKVEIEVPLIGTRERGIKIVGSFEPTLSVDLDWDIDGHSLEMLQVIPKLEGTFEGTVVASIASDDLTRRILLFSLEKTQWYLIGYVPVCITYKAPIYLTFSGKAEIGVEAGGIASLDIRTGFTYQKGQGVAFIADIAPSVDWIHPTVYGELTGKFGPSIGAGIALYGTLSIEALENTGLKLELRPELSSNPCAEARILFNASFFSGASAIVDFSIFDQELFHEEYELHPDIEFLPVSVPLIQSNENPLPGIEFPDTAELYVGTPVHFTQNARDPDGNIVTYYWDFGDGLTSYTAEPTHIYQAAGTYNLALTVEDNSGCSVTDEIFIRIQPAVSPADSGTISGAVRNVADSTFLSGVSVSASLGGSMVNTGATDASGNYTMVLPAANGYVLQFSKPGYLTATYQNVDVTANDVTYLEAVLQIGDAYAGSGTVSGMITNAFTGQGVSDVTVALREGINVTSGTVVASAQTGSGGYYSIADLPTGHYTAALSSSGYSAAYMTVVCLGNTTYPEQNGSITPILSTEEVRVVLTWGETPRDLDSHMTLPDDAGNRLHVYYLNRSVSIDSVEVANLDVDDTSSYGPETITLYRSDTGLMRYSVHDYSNRSSASSTALSTSGAKVEVYRGDGLFTRYNVPNEAGTLWTVFELENGQIRPVNNMSYESSPSNVRSLTHIPTQYDAELIRTQPLK